MALKGVLVGNVLLRFDDTVFAMTPSTENGTQSIAVTRIIGGDLQFQAYSGGLCIIDKASWATPTTSGVVSIITLT